MKKYNRHTKYLFFVLLYGLFSINIYGQKSLTHYNINIDLHNKGHMYEGIGALSAGASSRLLKDYPEKQKKEILDFLFKPYWGASLQHLKVEIGGDVNSTSGTEPSHARTKEELLAPKEEFFNRGYEWWLMKEAKKRNPDIYLDCLSWGAPGWIGNGNFYSDDNIDYIISFIKGAYKYHGISIDYTGLWNERAHNIEFAKNLKKDLLNNNLKHVKLIASDQCSGNQWAIADDILLDSTLSKAIDVIGDHYIEKEFNYTSTEAAKKTKKPLWNSEGGPWRGDWEGFGALCKLYNRGYIKGKLTKTITWSLITSYYENLALPNSGLMKANSPWSGYYEVQPALWAVAHTTQFAQPGWFYIDDTGCGLLANEKISYVTLVSPSNDNDFSCIVEAIDLNENTTISFTLKDKVKTKYLSVWKSTINKETFIKQKDIQIINNTFTLYIEPGSVYSITSTKGQQKGANIIPIEKPFPFPYFEDFENVPIGESAPYICDQGGAFEVHNSADNDKHGHVLRQLITQPCIEWEGPVINQTVVGDKSWDNYTASVDIAFNESYSYASLGGRILETHRSHQAPNGYILKLESSGFWTLFVGSKILKKGFVKIHDKWQNLQLKLEKDHIQAFINNVEVASIIDSTYSMGMASLGSSFHHIEFDNLHIF